MQLFTTPLEKRFWIYSLIVTATIYSTLIFGEPLLKLFADQNIRAAIFLFVIFLIGLTIVLQGIKQSPGKTEVIVWLGFVAVYVMLFLRLGMPERTHLMEYSVLAIFVHRALSERAGKPVGNPRPAFLAFGITVLIGVLDECLQLFLPARRFDPVDMVFNGLAALMSIGAVLGLQWVRKTFGRKP